MLLVYTLIALAASALDPSEVTGGQWMYQIVNLALVFGLIKGLAWAYAWTLLRVGLGVVVTLVMVATGSLAPETLVDVLLYLLIGVALIGAPGLARDHTPPAGRRSGHPCRRGMDTGVGAWMAAGKIRGDL